MYPIFGQCNPFCSTKGLLETNAREDPMASVNVAKKNDTIIDFILEVQAIFQLKN